MDPPGQLDVTVQIEDRRVVVIVRGEVDAATCGRLHLGLGEAIGLGAPQIAVDLSETTFMDSSGLNALLAAYRELGRAEAIVIRDPSGRSLKLLEVTGSDELFPPLPEEREQQSSQ